MNLRDIAIKEARIKRLNEGLLSLSEWCKTRAENPHDQLTTLTMLERKAAELRLKVNKAGWAASNQFEEP